MPTPDKDMLIQDMLSSLQIGSATDSSQRSELVNGQERSVIENPQFPTDPPTEDGQEP